MTLAQIPFCLAFVRRVPLLFSALTAQSAAEGPGESAAQRALRGELAARLLTQYGNSLLRLAYSYLQNFSDAEDILQDTLEQFLKAAPNFETPGQEKAWLLRVAGNLCKNKIRHNRLAKTDELGENLAAAQAEDLSFVWEAVRRLPVKYRACIHLFYHEGCSGAEIAEILGLNEATVRSNLSRGRGRLKKILGEVYDFEESV